VINGVERVFRSFVANKPTAMETGMLHLHSVLRWVILLLLLITLFQAIAKKPAIRQTSLWLLIASHTMMLIGLYQLIAGRHGITKVTFPEGQSLMENSFYRFFWVEHPLLTITAIILITIARGKSKKLNYRAVTWLLLIALILLLVAIPWPFRDIGAGRTWFPGM
jgi:hypothetical protein